MVTAVHCERFLSVTTVSFPKNIMSDDVCYNAAHTCSATTPCFLPSQILHPRDFIVNMVMVLQKECRPEEEVIH